MTWKLWNWDDPLEFNSIKAKEPNLCDATLTSSWLKASPGRRCKFGRDMFLSVKNNHWRGTQLLAPNIHKILGNEYLDYEERFGCYNTAFTIPSLKAHIKFYSYSSKLEIFSFFLWTIAELCYIFLMTLPIFYYIYRLISVLYLKFLWSDLSLSLFLYFLIV